MEPGQLISNHALTLADVPPQEAELNLLEAFCLTINGYQGERFSIDDLLALAEHVERQGLANASLIDLRRTAFIHQRHLRWTTYGDDEADAPLVRKIRETVAEIRSRLASTR